MAFERKIIHVDMDSFFASVEIRDNPDLAGKAVAIAGKNPKRGVLSTCNYEARKFGLHSAMPTAHALRLCPEVILVPGNMEKYSRESKKIQAIFKRYTSLVEPLSLDEAFLDVTASDLFGGSATLIAQNIRETIHAETGLTASAGVAGNKFLAKVASDWNKPNGQLVIPPEKVFDFLELLPLEKVWGVGMKTAARLKAQGFSTCGELRHLSRTEMETRFTNLGIHLYHLVRGEDNRPVSGIRHRKSLSIEKTFSDDILSDKDLTLALDKLYSNFLDRLDHAMKSDRKLRRTGICFVKLRFGDFRTTTVEKKVSDIAKKRFRSLLHVARQRGTGGIRLLGIGVRFAEKIGMRSPQKRQPTQTDLFDG